MKKVVPILITWDIDPTPEATLADKKKALDRAAGLLKDLQIDGTFFFHAMIAGQLEQEIRSLAGNGHEIGCHGLTHGDEEEYDRMPREMQRAYLSKATNILNEMSHRPIISFRGPRVKTSQITHDVLEELGYVADCSVASQRIDLVSSNLINTGWIFAPRLPYHPSNTNAFRRGERKIWVVPISAMLLPFISSTLYALRLRFMKCFFQVLYRESLRTGKPIVYLVHPFEFAPFGEVSRPRLSISSIRTHGLLVREKFYVKDEKKRFEMNKALFVHMKSYPNTRFMTVGGFISTMLMRPDG